MGRCRFLLIAILMFLPKVSEIGVQAENLTDSITDFERRINSLGIDVIEKDYSGDKKISFDEPSCAYINITGTESMPSTKSQSMNVWMDVYLGDGSYFRKRAVISAQGNSSLAFEKKNFKADFCEDEWVGEKTTSIAIGDWVKQDGFHFKSYYIDWLRGIGVVGYRLYDQMIQDEGRPWTRAIECITDPKENARCFPDGFPCVVYLNGDFYGIFAWQLKKHRDNMNQKKAIAEHIHLDGTLSDAVLWQTDSIRWGMFEVRNPKSLYTMDGEKYDGDNPKDLMDETSAYYDLDSDEEGVKADKQRTAQVKQYVQDLSHVYGQMKLMVNNKVSDDELRAYFEEHFDLPSLVDYACLHFVINNFDGFTKNWQWFTYDGKKWFVAPYDLDCCFGNYYMGYLTLPAEWNSIGESLVTFRTHGPFYWMNKLYKEEIADRYVYLRSSGVIDSLSIHALIEDWYGRVGDSYADEWLRWPNSMCITETVCNEGWQLVGVDGYWKYPEWDSTVLYHPGNRCQMSQHLWEAVDEVGGGKTFRKTGVCG